MNERHRRMLIFAALPVALVWGYYNLIVKPKAVTTAPAATGVAEASAPAASVIQSDSLSHRIAAIKSQSWGTDPFHMGTRRMVPSYSAPEPKRTDIVWQLNGIIYNEYTPYAYINGRSVKVGDIVNSAKVLAIDRKTVTLDVNGGRITLTLRKGGSS